MSTNLLDTTIDLARTCPLSVTRICRDVGLTTRWYYKVIGGEITDPSVRRVQALHDYLQAHKSQTAA